MINLSSAELAKRVEKINLLHISLCEGVHTLAEVIHGFYTQFSKCLNMYDFMFLFKQPHILLAYAVTFSVCIQAQIRLTILQSRRFNYDETDANVLLNTKRIWAEAQHFLQNCICTHWRLRAVCASTQSDQSPRRALYA